MGKKQGQKYLLGKNWPDGDERILSSQFFLLDVMSRWLKPSAHFFGCRMAFLFAVGFNPLFLKKPKKKQAAQKSEQGLSPLVRTSLQPWSLAQGLIIEVVFITEF